MRFWNLELGTWDLKLETAVRIIAGKFRGRKLKSPPSLDTRPSSDRLRETLFNIIAPRIEGARFLDLCAGSGAVGIEALSRGAAHATFIDRSRKMSGLIRASLDMLKVNEDEFEVVGSEALEFLRRRTKKESGTFDIIFFDPPYETEYEDVLDHVGEWWSQLLAEDGVVVVEHHKKKDLPEGFGELQRYRILKQGDSCLSFYRRVLAT